MMTRCRGFTLLEMTLAILLLAAISQWVISRLPSAPADHPLDRLLQSARWAAEQAQIERRIYQIQLDAQRWQVFALASGSEGVSGPLPDTVWQPVYDRHANGTLNDGILQLQSPPQTLPIALWYMPDGDMTQAALEFIGREGERRQLHITPATLFATELE
ncbi:type II secretion system protein J [Pantoea dispersa]|uniref:PulJ/GspJ family protein n=1 Tax=Pantoea dispersa TaxID=59814 RepID=UPI0039B5DB35